MIGQWITEDQKGGLARPVLRAQTGSTATAQRGRQRLRAGLARFLRLPAQHSGSCRRIAKPGFAKRFPSGEQLQCDVTSSRFPASGATVCIHGNGMERRDSEHSGREMERLSRLSQRIVTASSAASLQENTRRSIRRICAPVLKALAVANPGSDKQVTIQ